MDGHVFDEVADVVRGMAPDGLGELQVRARRWGIKVWFGGPEPSRVHYEAQMMGRSHLDGGEGMALEIGFHAEEKDEAKNQAELEGLLLHQRLLKKELGGEVVAGAFLGNPSWRRVSEVWLEVDLTDPDAGLEIGSRLVDYLEILEPLRNS